MALLDLGTLTFKIGMTGADEVSDQLTYVAKDVQTFGDTLSTLSEIGSKLESAISEPLINIGKQCVTYASDLTETISKTETVFDEMTDTVLDWSENSVQSMGMAQQTALEMASTFGDFGTSMGLSTETAAEMSMQLTQLAADMASFKNISIERANIALNAIYTGETESLKAMGIVMTQANLQAYANTQGIQKNISAMTQQELVTLRYRYVLSQTKNAQGDFVRTGDSLANQTRKLSENVKELATGFGQILEPAVTKVVSVINDVVSMFDGMSTTMKAVIVGITSVAAALPIIITLGTGIVNVVSSIRTALTALVATPVGAAITAIAAAAVIAGGVIAGVAQNIKEYNEVVDAMEDKHTSVTTSYENMVSTHEEEGSTASDTLSAIQQTLTDAADLIVYIKTNEATIGQQKSSEYTLDAIEAAIAARELYCEIAGKKPEDDEVWKELKDLQDGITTGTITVSGSDTDGTLATVTELLETAKTDLAALEAYETNTIAPKIAFEEDPDKSAQDLLDKCKEIAGYDGTDVDFIFGYTGLNDLETALGTAIASSENWTGTMEEINTALDTMLEKQKEVLLSISVAQAMAALQANAAGSLTDAQLEATLTAINTQYREMAANVDTNSAAYTNLIAVLNDGDPSNDVEAWKNFAGSMQDLGIAMTDTQTPAEKVATASGEITQAMENGATNTDAMSGSVAEMNDGLSDLSDNMSNEVDTAYDTYNTAIDDINASEAEQVAAVDEAIASRQLECDVLDTYKQALNETGGNVKEATEITKQAFSDQEASTIESITKQVDAEKDYNTQIDNLCRDLNYQVSELTKTKEADKQAIESESAEKRKAAEQQLGTDLGNITSGFDQTQLQALKTQCESIGNSEGASYVDRIYSLQGYCNSAKSMTEDGNFDMLALNKQYINDVEGLSESGYKATNDVGNEMGEGWMSALKQWHSRLIAQVKSTVNGIISEAQRAADIHSPSRKMRDKVGKPLMQGIEQGIDVSTPAVIDSVQDSMSRIISAATPTINWSTRAAATGGASSGNNRGSTIINQTNNFATREMTPYEQQLEIKRLNRGLAEVYA